MLPDVFMTFIYIKQGCKMWKSAYICPGDRLITYIFDSSHDALTTRSPAGPLSGLSGHKLEMSRKQFIYISIHTANFLFTDLFTAQSQCVNIKYD